MYHLFQNAGVAPTRTHRLAGLASRDNFNLRVGAALGGAFGGNNVAGPISHLVNRLGDGFVGAGFGDIAGILPNYVPNADGHGIYFGPNYNPRMNDYFGNYRAQSYVNPYETKLGHHNDPRFPGNIRGGHAEMDQAVEKAIQIARQITRNTGEEPRIILLG